MKPINIHADLTITTPNDKPFTVKSSGREVTVAIPDVQTAFLLRGQRGVMSELGVTFAELMQPHADVDVLVTVNGVHVASLIPGQQSGWLERQLGISPLKLKPLNALLSVFR